MYGCLSFSLYILLPPLPSTSGGVHWQVCSTLCLLAGVSKGGWRPRARLARAPLSDWEGGERKLGEFMCYARGALISQELLSRVRQGPESSSAKM